MRDFTRKPARIRFAKVYVSGVTAEGKRTRPLLWCTFRTAWDARIFADRLRDDNPTWTVEVRP
jgi:hypothetical protein